jgi:hypothetical protein
METVDELYTVNWHSDEYPLESGQPCRISVFLDTAPPNPPLTLGHVDVIGLLEGRTLPIELRIEVGAD